MIQYTSENIDAMEKYNRYCIRSDITKLIDEYTNLVSSPNYNKTPHFLIKKSIILNSNRGKIDILQDSLKKTLNKITNKNYDKLILEVVTILNNLFNHIKEDNTEKGKIIEVLFNSFFLSSINIDLNIRLCFRIIEEFNFIEDYFNNFINNIKNLYKDINICRSISFEELDKVNKNNSIVKNKIIFYCRLQKTGRLDKKLLNNCIIHYQNLIFNISQQDNSKLECDEISELLLTFLNEKDELIMDDPDENIIINNIKTIANSNVNDKRNLSYKIILKHKNILSKLNL